MNKKFIVRLSDEEADLVVAEFHVSAGGVAAV